MQIIKGMIASLGLLVILFLTIIGALFIFELAVKVYASEKDVEPTSCPEGYFWRGGCVRVTGCPWGDSIPMKDCDKFAPNQETEEENNTWEGEIVGK